MLFPPRGPRPSSPPENGSAALSRPGYTRRRRPKWTPLDTLMPEITNTLQRYPSLKPRAGAALRPVGYGGGGANGYLCPPMDTFGHETYETGSGIA